MLELPQYIPVFFILTVLVTLSFFIYAVRKSNIGISGSYVVLVIVLLWLIFQLLVSLRGFYYTDTKAMPPRFGWLIMPPLVLITLLFATDWGRAFIDSLPLAPITCLSIVRIPVELTLYWLCFYKYVPELMTYLGRNFDLISGNTAPFVAYAIYRRALSNRMILLCNIMALCLLLNVVVNAVLSAPLAFQQFAFDQPNVGLLYFPFIWLPSFIVPVVLFTHLVSIRRMLLRRQTIF
jgi:hypothetical protein